MEKISAIYAIINIENNKAYIGSTTNLRKRWQQHILHLNKNIHCTKKLQNDWNTYGSENFKFIILEQTNITKQEMRKLEDNYMTKYGSVDNGYNYNLNYNRPLSDETKQKIRNTLTGSKRKPHSDETKIKMSQSRKAVIKRNKNPNLENILDDK